MTVEKDVLISLLKLTQTGPVRKDTIAKSSRIPSDTADRALRKLSQAGLFDEYEDVIEASANQRVRMAVHALRLGADVQRVSRLLSWKEFESIAAEAFETNDYQVLKNFHFKHASKRWEIDIVCLKKPLILCVDCKHWKRGWGQAATANAVEAQVKRTEAFAKALPNYQQRMKIEAWKAVTIIPIIMSLAPGPCKFYDDVPIVPVLQLQDFISELPTQVDLLKSFHQNCLRINENLRQFS